MSESTWQQRAERAEEAADRLAATVVLLAYDAHPIYPNTSRWGGGIGGQAMTQGCSIIDPPPGEDWTQYDLPTGPARDWINQRDMDLEAVKRRLKDEWLAELRPATPPTTSTPAAPAPKETP